MLKLKDVTLIGVDCWDANRLIKAINVCASYADFYDIKILSSIQNNSKYSVKINEINSKDKYSYFILKELDNYFESNFVLLVQWDGFILNPDAWVDDFLEYDYIGAPWFHNSMSAYGGNGGFSLRSKKLQSILKNYANLKFSGYEDSDICLSNREYLLSQGIKYAPADKGSLFSKEIGIWNNEFGFHNFDRTDINNWNDKNKFGY